MRVAAKQMLLIGVAQQGQYAVADQVGSGLLTADHQENAVRDNVVFAKEVSIQFCRKHGMNETALGIAALLTNRIAKIGAHLIKVAQHLR